MAMISIGDTILVIIFSLLLIGFIDLFIKEQNRCEMTYMYQMPEYVEIDMNTNVRRMFGNYHLYAYGEGQYAETLRLNEFNGQPILFVPGNAGSHKQVRSLASVALMMSAKKASHMNYFTIDYNEELSAFIGDKLEQQTKFLYHSIRRILELYRHVPNIRLILIGHSVGGILIRSLLTKDSARSFLPYISIVLTLASPNIHPAINYNYKTLTFYEQINVKFNEYLDTKFSNINFISIGGSYQDMIIRPDLIRLNSTRANDLTILTTAISDVWVSADHLCIVWCRQLIIKLNRMFFDLIDSDTSVFIDSVDLRQRIINYHLVNRLYSKDRYPSNILLTNISTTMVKSSSKTESIELTDRLVRLKFLKIIKPINYMIRFKEREMIVIYLEGNLRADTVSIGNCIVENPNNTECIGNVFTMTSLMQLVPPKIDSNIDRHSGRFDSDKWLQKGFTHLIINLSPSQSSKYTIIVDRFTKSIRRQTIALPNPFVNRWTNPLESKIVFSKHISQEQSYYELTIDNFNYIWDTYWITVHTTACYQNDSTFVGFMQLIYPSHPELNEYIWPLKPNKHFQYQFQLTRHTNNDGNDMKNRPKIHLYLEPNCSFDLNVKYSFTGSIAQLLRHYYMILIPMIISIIILILSIQFSNLCNRYTFANDNQLQRYKTFIKQEDLHEKCYQFQSSMEIMACKHYFMYCMAQILPTSLLSLFLLDKFYQTHDLINLASLQLPKRLAILILLFLFAYSFVYVSVILVTHLANNFANGLLFFRIRFFNSNTFAYYYLSIPGFNHLKRYLLSFSIIIPFNTKILTKIFDLFILLIYLNIIIYFMPLTYCFIHFIFTISMLYWFSKAKQLELRVGQTTATTLIQSLYPMIFLLLMTITIIHLPYCIDWIFRYASKQMFNRANILNIAYTNLSTIYVEDIFLVFCLTTLMIMFYQHSLLLSSRLHSYELNRTQKINNIILILIAFINLLISVQSLESIRMIIMLTLISIIYGHFYCNLWKQINIDNTNENEKISNLTNANNENIINNKSAMKQNNRYYKQQQHQQQKLFKSD